MSAIDGSILSLVAFMLAFTFSLVANRFDERKSLVREEANAIRTAWARSDFLPETDRAEARRLMLEYVGGMLDTMREIEAGTKSPTMTLTPSGSSAHRGPQHANYRRACAKRPSTVS